MEINNNKFKDLYLKATKEVKIPNWLKIFSNLIILFCILAFILLIFTPWQQTSKGNGKLTALDPNDRVQNITSNIEGNISKWLVVEGAKVKEGDPLVEIKDNDPNFIERLKLERDAIYKKYIAAKEASDTAYLNVERQENLFKEGLTSKTKVEKSKIEYKKLLAAEATASANLSIAEVKLSRQQNQMIVAPRNGTLLRILHSSGSVYIKEGDSIATFVPDTKNPAVEIYVNGNDLPLIYKGRKVRLQFEGWPAVQFSGWPSVAIGTFGGEVTLVDSSSNLQGKFRVLISPEKDTNWPNAKYLRQGTRVFAWILLNEVSLGYEIWRKLNGFPYSLDSEPTGDFYQKRKMIKKKETKKYKEIYK